MEAVLTYLDKPLFHGSPLRYWEALSFCAGLLLVFFLVLILARKRKRRKAETPDAESTAATESGPPPELELANLQGLGSREEQQDAFGISPVSRLEEDGLLAVLCDGMGGMAEGGRIASDTVSEMLSIFPWKDDLALPEWIRQWSSRVYKRFRGRGGTTLVAAVLRKQELHFCCVGDSDLFLLRDGSLYSMNTRQEFKNDLVLRALNGAFPLEAALTDPQAGALTEYIGKEDLRCDCTRLPFTLLPEDVLLLSSDGVSDTLTLKQIREAMALPPRACCDRLEVGIMAAGNPKQDNFTAIVLKYHGKGEKENE